MYIYELPFEINKELCRLLDHDNDWKELAGNYMKYSAFDVNEIEQMAKRQMSSPTDQLFRTWGQLNHRVEELFVLLHRMKHVPALRCLVPIMDHRFHSLLQKHDKNLKEKHPLSSNGINIQKQKTLKVEASEDNLPVPVLRIKKGLQSPPPVILRKSTDNTNSDSSRNTTTTQGVHEEVLRNASAIPMLSYDDLKKATNNWSSKNLLGRGGFGYVFKGEWKLLPVAVKRLRDNDDKHRELICEMCLNQYRHDNILPLYGYSLGGPETCLVYQLMAGGSLEQRLRLKSDQPPLTWPQRYRIAHGVARGLQYLHTMEGTPLIHGDIKPANILLDQCTMPKIGDFGLARKGPYGDDRQYLQVSNVKGTRPYLPEDYLLYKCLSPAVDVFSYGVVMLEMATALPVLDKNREIVLLSDYIHHVAAKRIDCGGKYTTECLDIYSSLTTPPCGKKCEASFNIATLEDSNLANTPNSNPQLCREFVSIGIHCTKYRGKERPTMLDIYKRLDAMEFPGKHVI